MAVRSPLFVVHTVGRFFESKESPVLRQGGRRRKADRAGSRHPAAEHGSATEPPQGSRSLGKRPLNRRRAGDRAYLCVSEMEIGGTLTATGESTRSSSYIGRLTRPYRDV